MFAGFLVLCGGAATGPRPEFATFEYASSVDGTRPLRADVAFVRDHKRKPLLVVMHGYHAGRKAVAADLEDLGTRGVFAVAPDMRGSGDSAGKWDSGGLDVHDIADAALEAVRRWPDEIDPANLNIVGYSGGGGNAIACMVRFPDLFRTYVSFFGISDYGGWHRSRSRPDCNQTMEAALGGTPDALPDVYLARNAIPAAANARCGRLHFFWDEEETACPPDMVEDFVRTYRRAGLRRATLHVSRKGDASRWIHGYRTDNPALAVAQAAYLPDVLRPGRAVRMPAKGRLVVPGYMVTRRFQVWVEDGGRGQVTVDYDCTGKLPVIKVVDNPGSYRVRIETSSPLADLP